MKEHHMKSYHIYGVGAALVDTEIEVDDAFLAANGVEKGQMTLVNQQRRDELMEALKDHLVHSCRASGGSGANTAIAASYFGSDVFYSSKVSSDEYGQFYLKDMKEAGVSTCKLNGNNEGITGKCLVLVTPDAERSMNTYLGISETLSINEIDEDALKASEYVYIEGYQVTSETGRVAAIHARELAEKHGVKTALSLSDPGMVKFFREGLEQIIGESGVDMLFSNRREALCWADTDDLDVAIEALKKVARAFAITLGPRGAIVFDGEKLIKIEPYPAKPIDTNGAGDTFAGAFLYAITAGYSYQQAGDLASCASANVVSSYGPRLSPEKYSAIQKEILG